MNLFLLFQRVDRKVRCFLVYFVLILLFQRQQGKGLCILLVCLVCSCCCQRIVCWYRCLVGCICLQIGWKIVISLSVFFFWILNQFYILLVWQCFYMVFFYQKMFWNIINFLLFWMGLINYVSFFLCRNCWSRCLKLVLIRRKLVFLRSCRLLGFQIVRVSDCIWLELVVVVLFRGFFYFYCIEVGVWRIIIILVFFLVCLLVSSIL